MKTIAKLIASALVVFGVMVTSSSCDKNHVNTQSGGTMTVKMTDAPSAYSQVNVEIVAMTASTAKGWVNVPIHPGVYDLMKLRNNAEVILAENAYVTVGKVNQIRLILGANNYVVLSNDERHNLTLSSQAETGLKINIDKTVASGEHFEVLLDFNAEASVLVTSTGEYKLKPVIHVKSITQ